MDRFRKSGLDSRMHGGCVPGQIAQGLFGEDRSGMDGGRNDWHGGHDMECPDCGVYLEHSMPIGGVSRLRMESGDSGVCCSCGAILVAEELSLRPASDREIERLKRQPYWPMLKSASEMARSEFGEGEN